MEVSLKNFLQLSAIALLSRVLLLHSCSIPQVSPICREAQGRSVMARRQLRAPCRLRSQIYFLDISAMRVANGNRRVEAKRRWAIDLFPHQRKARKNPTKLHGRDGKIRRTAGPSNPTQRNILTLRLFSPAPLWHAPCTVDRRSVMDIKRRCFKKPHKKEAPLWDEN